LHELILPFGFSLVSPTASNIYRKEALGSPIKEEEVAEKNYNEIGNQFQIHFIIRLKTCYGPLNFTGPFIFESTFVGLMLHPMMHICHGS
jgi:hypothetical protein